MTKEIDPDCHQVGKDAFDGKFNDLTDPMVNPEYWITCRSVPLAKGRPRKFPTAIDLFNGCHNYFEWNRNNPLYKHEWKDGGIERIPTMRAMSIGRLCQYLVIQDTCWRDYADGHRDTKEHNFSGIAAWAKDVIRRQKMEGASSGHLVATIIMRDLGLRERTSTELSGPEGGAVKVSLDTSKLSTDALVELTGALGSTDEA